MTDVLEDQSVDLQSSIDYMTKSHLRNVMQLAVFYTTNDEIYAINISKIQSFLIKDEIEILKAPTENPYVVGLIDLRGEIIQVVNFDKWLGYDADIDKHKIIIVCNYNQRKVGILAKDIIKIEEKASNELKIPNSKDPKISYVTDIEIDENRSEKCIVFDAERLLYDANSGDDTTKSTIYDVDSFQINSKLNSNKKILIAEDSQIVIQKLNQFFKNIGANFEIYENGQLLIDRIDTVSPEEIGLIITDIEMPVKNGYQVIKYVRSEPKFEHIPILSLTSMTNQGVRDKVIGLGAKELINKSDLNTLHEQIINIFQGEK